MSNRFLIRAVIIFFAFCVDVAQLACVAALAYMGLTHESEYAFFFYVIAALIILTNSLYFIHRHEGYSLWSARGFREFIRQLEEAGL